MAHGGQEIGLRRTRLLGLPPRRLGGLACLDQCRLDLLAPIDVEIQADQPDRMAVSIEIGAADPMDPADAAVGQQYPELGRIDLLSLDRLLDCCPHLYRVVGMDNLVPLGRRQRRRPGAVEAVHGRALRRQDDGVGAESHVPGARARRGLRDAQKVRRFQQSLLRRHRVMDVERRSKPADDRFVAVDRDDHYPVPAERAVLVLQADVGGPAATGV